MTFRVDVLKQKSVHVSLLLKQTFQWHLLALSVPGLSRDLSDLTDLPPPCLSTHNLFFLVFIHCGPTTVTFLAPNTPSSFPSGGFVPAFFSPWAAHTPLPDHSALSSEAFERQPSSIPCLAPHPVQVCHHAPHSEMLIAFIFCFLVCFQ